MPPFCMGTWRIEQENGQRRRGMQKTLGWLAAEECGQEVDTQWSNMERNLHRKYAGQRDTHILHLKVHDW